MEDNEMDAFTRQRERYLADRDAKREARKQRREKVEAAIAAAGSPITVLQRVASGEFHNPVQRKRNRADRRAVGMVKPRNRDHKDAYSERGETYRETVALHRELHRMKTGLTSFIHKAARHVRGLG